MHDSIEQSPGTDGANSGRGRLVVFLCSLR
jgi:hypothetical protein